MLLVGVCGGGVYMCVFVCVRERETETDRNRETEREQKIAPTILFAQNLERFPGLVTFGGNIGKFPVPTGTSWPLSRVCVCLCVCARVPCGA